MTARKTAEAQDKATLKDLVDMYAEEQRKAQALAGQVEALDHGIKAAHHRERCLKGELTKLQQAQKAAKARIKELEEAASLRTAVPPPETPVGANYFADYVREKCKVADLQMRLDIARHQTGGDEQLVKFYKEWRDRETSRADKYQAEAEALRKVVPKAGTTSLLDQVYSPGAVAMNGLVGLFFGLVIGAAVAAVFL